MCAKNDKTKKFQLKSETFNNLSKLVLNVRTLLISHHTNPT